MGFRIRLLGFKSQLSLPLWPWVNYSIQMSGSLIYKIHKDLPHKVDLYLINDTDFIVLYINSKFFLV
jgi:hypothetical protein